MNFIKKNPHPNKIVCGDCVIRAIYFACMKHYEEAFIKLMEESRKQLLPFDNEKVFSKFLAHCEYKSHTVNKGETRPKVKDFSDGTYVLKIANHLTFVEDDELWDLWDCRNKAVYKSWKVR